MKKPLLALLLLSAVAQAQPAAVVMEPVTRLETSVGTLRFSSPLLAPRPVDRIKMVTSSAVSSYFTDMEKIARDNKLGRVCLNRYLLAKTGLPLDGTVAFTTAYHKALLPFMTGVSSSTDYTEFTNELGRQRQMVSILKTKGAKPRYWMNLFTYNVDKSSIVITACELG